MHWTAKNWETAQREQEKSSACEVSLFALAFRLNGKNDESLSQKQKQNIEELPESLA